MKRFEVWIVRLDPVLGSEIGKTRPAVVVSPDEANDSLRTVLVAPLTSTRRPWPTRIPLLFDGVEGDVALDQIRAVDKRRLAQRRGILSSEQGRTLTARLVEMFGP